MSVHRSVPGDGGKNLLCGTYYALITTIYLVLLQTYADIAEQICISRALQSMFSYRKE